jgi:hypothetical protein
MLALAFLCWPACRTEMYESAPGSGHGTRDATAQPSTGADAAHDDLGAASDGRDTSPTERAILTVSTPVVDFGRLVVGESPLVSITVSNVGSASTGVLALSASDGLALRGCRGALAAGGSCLLGIAVTSTTSGPFHGTIDITADRASPSPLLVVVQAELILPGVSIVIHPNLVTFTSVVVGAKGAPTELQVVNEGTETSAPLMVTMWAGDFVFLNDTCAGIALDPLRSCLVTVAFAPSSAGERTAVLTVGERAGAQSTASLGGLALSGATGIANPPALDFGAVPIGATSPSQTVTITNVGDRESGELTATQIGDVRAFRVVASTCVGNLPPKASCSLTLSFAPYRLDSDTSVYTLSGGALSVDVPMIGNGLSLP